MIVVNRQPFFNGLFAIVIALDQLLAGSVILASDFRGIETHMISTTRSRVHTTTTHAIHNGFIRHINFEHVINCHAGLFHRISLRQRARKTIKQIAIGAVRFFQTIFDQTDDDVIRHQATRIHHLLGSQAKRCAGFDRCPKHVAGRNLGNVETFFDVGRLRALTGTRRS